ncbi:MAG: NAD(P)/FAD-dependent oxidoreductase [Methanomicrobiales archaeon]|nr:NAD(P)/FAD-dependent oxidoreductase [Methanomicrobiales archaeon]
MRVCILGGGLCGLTAASALSNICEVEIFEKEDCLGGCLSSFRAETYSIERFYHHFFAGDESFIGLATYLGLKDSLEWLKGTTGYHADGRNYPLNTPLEILRYPYLSLSDKARLFLLTLKAKRMETELLDDITAKDFILRECGDGVYHSFFRPLLASKFGARANEVSAAWLVSRIAIRSNRGISGERLGYIKGGFVRLIDALRRDIEAKGGRIHVSSPVSSLERRGSGWTVNGIHFDRVISTIAPSELRRISGLDLPSIPYQGAASLMLGLSRDVTESVYWLNMKDPSPYGAVIAHTNFVPYERYGEHIVYLASYFEGNMGKDRERSMLADFMRRFSLKDEEVHWKRMAVEPNAGPVFISGYREKIPAFAERGLYLAGMFSRTNYPERSMEGSVKAALEVARILTEECGHGSD